MTDHTEEEDFKRLMSQTERIIKVAEAQQKGLEEHEKKISDLTHQLGSLEKTVGKLYTLEGMFRSTDLALEDVKKELSQLNLVITPDNVERLISAIGGVVQQLDLIYKEMPPRTP